MTAYARVGAIEILGITKIGRQVGMGLDIKAATTGSQEREELTECWRTDVSFAMQLREHGFYRLPGRAKFSRADDAEAIGMVLHGIEERTNVSHEIDHVKRDADVMPSRRLIRWPRRRFKHIDVLNTQTIDVVDEHFRDTRRRFDGRDALDVL